MSAKSRISAEPPVPKKWRWHHDKLQALRDALMKGREIQESGVAGSLAPGGADDLDRASEESDHDLALSLLTCEENDLKEVDDAIQRMQEGTYGICEETGERISAERLRVVPWTRHTKDVMERIERERSGKRPHLAAVSSIRDDLSDGLWESADPDDSNSNHTTYEP